jgi:hypothetical protein
MKTTGNLTDNHWEFVDSVLMAARSVFTSVVMSRYGGEAAQLVDPRSGLKIKHCYLQSLVILMRVNVLELCHFRINKYSDPNPSE